MSTPRTPGLEVFVDSAGESYQVLPPDTRRYQITTSIIDRGLLILESPGGWQALLTLAEGIIAGRRSRGEPCLYPDSDFERLDQYIKEFLGRMRHHCPQVYLTALHGEAAAIREDWAGPESTLEDFVPQEAGHLELEHAVYFGLPPLTESLLIPSQYIVHSMADPAKSDDYNMYMFQMAISVAHEVCHFLTGYLTGRAKPLTPRTIKVPGTDPEAGVYWEVIALGGIVEFYSHPDDPTNVDRAGIAYMFPDARRAARGRRVSISYVHEFGAGGDGFVLPVRTSSSSEERSREQVKKHSIEMSKLRERARAAQTVTRRRPNQSSTSRNRVLAQEEYYEGEYKHGCAR